MSNLGDLDSMLRRQPASEMFLSIMIFDALLACQARPLLDISKFDNHSFVLNYDFIPF